VTAAGGISTTLLLVSIDFADTKRASPDLQAQFQLRQEQLHTSGASGILTFTLAHASAGALHAATLDPLPQRLMLNNEAPRKLQEGGIDGSPFAGENKNCPVVKSGPVAQLGARFHGMEEVVGSIPTRSTIKSMTYGDSLLQFGRIWAQTHNFLARRAQFRLLSQFLADRLNCGPHAFWNLLHVDICCCGSARMPQ